MTPSKPFPKNPHEHAAAVAEAVAHAWHHTHGSDNIAVPLSVVAALSFLSPADDEREWTCAALQAASLDRFTEIIRAQWSIFIASRPDLVNRAWPLISVWHGDQPPDEATTVAAQQVADAAISAGLLWLTGTERRRHTDLFGPLLAELRPDSARDARGQIYTPGDIAHTLAELLLADPPDPAAPPEERSTIFEPSVGTGGMLRSAAAAMRAHGRDPATACWCAVDIDELAIACLSVNVVLWELGHDVVLGVGDALLDNWLDRALAERRETVHIAQTTALVRAFLRLTAKGDQP